MTINSNLMKAILAMDAYNRGYGAGIDTLPSSTNGSARIGNATIVATSSSLVDSNGNPNIDDNIGFYAIAYDLDGVAGGEKVISYRGTDDFDGPADLLTSKDVFHGWSLGAGNTASEQGRMAVQFYKSVAGTSIDPRAADISLTGHSLGGGLAGYVGSLYAKTATAFDSMAFKGAADSTYAQSFAGMDPALKTLVYGTQTPWLANSGGVSAFHTTGEVLHSDFIRQSPSTPIPLGTDVDLVAGSDSVALHSMATLVIRMFFADQDFTPTPGAWDAAAKYFWPVLYWPKAYESYVKGMWGDFSSTPGTLLTEGKLTDIVRMAIAYSAIDEGTNDTNARPFGDTGIRALYNDANDLGRALSLAGASKTLAANADSVARVFVEYAGDLALNKVLKSNFGAALSGVLTYADTANNHTLTVDFKDSTWKMGAATLTPAYTRTNLWWLFSDLADNSSTSYLRKIYDTTLWGNSLQNIAEKVVYATLDSSTTVLSQAPTAGKALAFIGGSGADTVTGSAGYDYIWGGDGNDILKYSAGPDYYSGSNGRDTLDLTAIASGVKFSAFVSYDQQNLYINDGLGANYAQSTKIGLAEGIEKILLGSAADHVYRPGYFSSAPLGSTESYSGELEIDGGGGVDILEIDRYVTANINGNRVTTSDNIAYANFEKIVLEGGLEIKTIGLLQGYNIQLDQGYIDYSAYNGKLNVVASSATIAVNDAANAAVKDIFSVISPWIGTVIGNDRDNTFSGEGAFLLGRGNDIVNATTAPQKFTSVIFTGGNDVVNNASHTSLFFKDSITPNMVHSNEVNIQYSVNTSAQRTYTYDISVTVDGISGSIRFNGLDKVVYSNDGIYGNGNDTIYDNSIDIRYGSYYWNGVPRGFATDDVIYVPESYDDWVNGAGGKDYIYGNQIGSRLFGGDGDDWVYGGGSLNFAPGTLLKDDHFDFLYGGEGADHILGEAGPDYIYGGGGNDIIEGGEGDDSIYGNAGADIFYFNSNSGVDVIEDFELGVDKINLSGISGASFSSLNITQGSPNHLSDFNLRTSESTIITVGGAKLYLYGITAPQLTAENFEFINGETFNRRPLLVADGAGTLQGVPLTIAVLANDSDPDGTPLTITKLGKPSNGTAVLNPDMTVTYTPNPGYLGDDSFTYVATDAAGMPSSATVYVSVVVPIVGTAGNDFLNTTTSSEIINGLAGNDSIYAGSGSDTISGGDGNDTITGSKDLFAANDGLPDNDTIDGGKGVDQLYGSWGDDTYVFRAGDSPVATPDYIYEVIDQGTDTIKLTGGILPASVTFTKLSSNYWYSLKFGTDEIRMVNYTSTSSTSMTSTNTLAFEKVAFDNGTVLNLADILNKPAYTVTTGNDTVNVSTATVGVTIDLLAGNDIFTGSNYNDNVSGSDGNDTIEGRAGNDIMNGGNGTDTVTYAGSTAAVTVNLATTAAQNTVGAGSDTITNFENLTGSGFNDTLTGNSNANTIDGGAGNDVIDGAAGNDILIGGTGTDRVTYASATAAVTVNLALTSAQNTIGAGTDTISGFENLTGSSYNDILTGDANANTIDGGSGNDTVQGGAGNDTMIGGSGTDTVTYAAATAAVTVNLTTTTAQNTLGAGTDTITTFENLTGSNFNDTLTGNSSSNVIEGLNGNDILDGAGGTDTVTYISAAAGVTVNLSLTTAQNTIGAGTDTIKNFENLTGSNFNDTLTGNSGSNTIEGGAGNDIMNGGTGTDKVTYANATAGVTVNLALTTAQNTVGAGTDTVSAFENLTGSNFNDTLTGNSGSNTIEGGAGNDIMDGGTGTDTVTYTGATAAVTVNLALTTAQNTLGAGTDTITNFEKLTGSGYNDTLRGNTGDNTVVGGSGNDTVYGNSGNDIIYGDSGTDTIYGDAGNDTLYGGSSNDTLYGGTGSDIFKFQSSGGIDTVKDFKTSELDKLDIKSLLSGYDPLTKAITDYIQITTSGTSSIVNVDADGLTGGTVWTQIATLENIIGLTDEAALKTNGTIIA